MKNKVLTIMATVLMMTGCAGNQENMNPFYSEYHTPFGVPPFHKIENKHFLPAFQEGIRQQEKEIQDIISSKEIPDFQNTILAFDQSGSLIRKVGGVFYRLRSAETCNEIDSIAELLIPLTSAHKSNMMLNEDLFRKVKFVHENSDRQTLKKEQVHVLEKIYLNFIKGGANLDSNGKARIREIDEELSLLSLQFGNNLLAETNSFKLWIDDKKKLAGLPSSVISAAADAASMENEAQGNWLFTLHKPSWIPFLTYSENRDLREEIYRAMFMRGNNKNEFDNKEIIVRTLMLRLERAKLLGYETHAHFALSDRMAGSPDKVYDLLTRIWEPALKKAGEEAEMMRALIREEGNNFELESWDWWYYAEKIRKEKYDLSDEEVRPYFSLETVKDGLFSVVNQLYGLKFVKRNDLPLYHPEVQAYEVMESDDSHVGILYMDFHPRHGKNGGAWSTSIRPAHTENQQRITPVHLIVMNFTRPTGNKPALISFDESLTFYHEFGHALHSMLTKCDYLTTSGTSVARDFVELPSQIMENWAAHPEVLREHARHFESGEVIPESLISKLEASGKFNQGFATVEYIAASILDMDYHCTTDLQNLDVETFEKSSMDKLGLIDEIIPRYRSSYFQHIFSGGYAAGYYAYIWAEVLDKDAFNAFLDAGLFDRKTALAFRQYILEKGGSEEEMDMYIDFRGQEPGIESLLKGRGL